MLFGDLELARSIGCNTDHSDLGALTTLKYAERDLYVCFLTHSGGSMLWMILKRSSQGGQTSLLKTS